MPKNVFFPSFVEDLEFFYYYEQDCQHIEIKTLAQFFFYINRYFSKVNAYLYSQPIQAAVEGLPTT